MPPSLASISTVCYACVNMLHRPHCSLSSTSILKYGISHNEKGGWAERVSNVAEHMAFIAEGTYSPR